MSYTSWSDWFPLGQCDRNGIPNPPAIQHGCCRPGPLWRVERSPSQVPCPTCPWSLVRRARRLFGSSRNLGSEMPPHVSRTCTTNASGRSSTATDTSPWSAYLAALSAMVLDRRTGQQRIHMNYENARPPALYESHRPFSTDNRADHASFKRSRRYSRRPIYVVARTNGARPFHYVVLLELRSFLKLMLRERIVCASKLVRINSIDMACNLCSDAGTQSDGTYRLKSRIWISQAVVRMHASVVRPTRMIVLACRYDSNASRGVA
jgi:hypothetical protein